jgi:prepilin-type N-terminal cleavage/methylation domain-containing protein
MKNIKNTTQRGFTLIETFVAVSILSLAVVAPLTLASRSLSTARYARDQVVASNLAQDAIEFVRAKRDFNLIAIAKTGAGDWAAGLPTSTPPQSDKPFVVDSVSGVVTECASVCDKILFDNATGLYTYTTGNPSLFTRTVTMKISPTNALESTVRVVVSWRSAVYGGQRSVIIEDQLYGWIPEQN